MSLANGIRGRSSGMLYSMMSSLRWRQRLFLLAYAFLVALAVDLAYDIIGIIIVLLGGPSIYFPLLFFITLAVLLFFAFNSTRQSIFAVRLDQNYNLKDRLFYAYHNSILPGMSDMVVEAQATECLEKVNFEQIRKETKFRPYIQLVMIALFVGGIGFAYWKSPYLFEARNIIFRSGSGIIQSLSRDSIENGEEGEISVSGLEEYHQPEENEGKGSPRVKEDRENSKLVMERRQLEKEKNTRSDGNQPDIKEKPEGKKDKAETKQDSKNSSGKQSRGKNADKEYSPPGIFAPSDTIMKMPSIEVTRQPSLPVDKVESPFLPPPMFTPFDRKEVGFLPPIPLLRFIQEVPDDDFFTDPDTVYIFPQAYPVRYRSNIINYFSKLQEIKDGQIGP